MTDAKLDAEIKRLTISGEIHINLSRAHKKAYFHYLGKQNYELATMYYKLMMEDNRVVHAIKSKLHILAEQTGPAVPDCEAITQAAKVAKAALAK